MLDSPSLCDASRTQLWCESPGPPQFRPPAWSSGCQFVPGQCLLDVGSPSRDARTFFRAHNVGQAPERGRKTLTWILSPARGPVNRRGLPRGGSAFVYGFDPGRRAGFPFYSSLCTLVGLSPSPHALPRQLSIHPQVPESPPHAWSPAQPLGKAQAFLLHKLLLKGLLFPEASRLTPSTLDRPPGSLVPGIPSNVEKPHPTEP